MNIKKLEIKVSDYVSFKIRNYLMGGILMPSDIDDIRQEIFRSVQAERKAVNYPNFLTLESEQKCCYEHKKDNGITDINEDKLLNDWGLNLKEPSAFEVELVRGTAPFGLLIDFIFYNAKDFWSKKYSCLPEFHVKEEAAARELFGAFLIKMADLFYINTRSAMEFRRLSYIYRAVPDAMNKILPLKRAFIDYSVECEIIITILAKWTDYLEFYTNDGKKSFHIDYLTGDPIKTIKQRVKWLCRKGPVDLLLNHLNEIYPYRRVATNEIELKEALREFGSCSTPHTPVKDWFRMIADLWDPGNINACQSLAGKYVKTLHS